MTNNIYIGLMSGTSLDGIDTVLVSFNQEDQPSVIHTQCLPLTSSLQDEIKLLVNPAENELNRLTSLDVQLATYFADAIIQLLEGSNINKEQVVAIGSHGQTIRHLPNAKHPSTLQIGDPNIIAELTGITTVADFRRRDMAAGGQGAPLVPAFHEKLFRHKNKNRLILNLGGIANITIIPAEKSIPVTGFDTGPANTLMNYWIQQKQNKTFDEAGQWAASGRVNEDFLQRLLNDDYFQLTPPKSTGTEYFNAAWLATRLASFPALAPEDIQASLALFTAKTIGDAINEYAMKIAEVNEIIICGGGVHNEFLLQQLRQELPGIEINSSAKYGLDPDYIEAIAFAWLAKQTLEHKPGNLPEVTGAKRAVVLGGIYY